MEPQATQQPTKLPTARVMVVDDDPVAREASALLLQEQGHRVLLAETGMAALAMLANPDTAPDLVLLDVLMPGMDGFAVLGALRASAKGHAIPVLMLTARGRPDEEERALALGANDYLTKPVQAAVLLARVRTQLEAATARRLLADRNQWLEAEVAHRMAENQRIQTVTLRALAHLAETRDPETGQHLQRTQAYVRELATALREDGLHTETLTDTYLRELVDSAPLHDIGKVGIPDHILLKPGKLNAAEWAVMKTHAALGAHALEQAEAEAGAPLPFLKTAREIARWHHEHWDGGGYPDGLRGEAIPLSARLMAVADVFDSLVSPRVYKQPMDCEQAQAIIQQGRGTHFDPVVVDAFERRLARFCSIATAQRNTDQPHPGCEHPGQHSPTDNPPP